MGDKLEAREIAGRVANIDASVGEHGNRPALALEHPLLQARPKAVGRGVE